MPVSYLNRRVAGAAHAISSRANWARLLVSPQGVAPCLPPPDISHLALWDVIASILLSKPAHVVFDKAVWEFACRLQIINVQVESER